MAARCIGPSARLRAIRPWTFRSEPEPYDQQDEDNNQVLELQPISEPAISGSAHRASSTPAAPRPLRVEPGGEHKDQNDDDDADDAEHLQDVVRVRPQDRECEFTGKHDYYASPPHS